MARIRRNRRARRRVAKKARRSRVPRSLSINPQNQGATVIETISASAACVTNAQIGLNIFDLSMFPRAQQTAALFKFYKAEYCEWEYQPRYTLYSPGAAVTQPYIYTAMNRTQDAAIGLGPGTAQQFMMSQGSVPRKFNSKIVLRYKPNWVSPGLIAQRVNAGTNDLNAVGSCGVRINYGWLACPDNVYTAGSVNTVMTMAQPSATSIPNGFAVAQNFPQSAQYNGHYTWFDDSTVNENPVGDIVLRVKWVFKNPAFFVTGPRDPPPVDLSGNLVLQV